jgi:RNA polymerase sigma-70 factor, ECF subfamily
VGKLGPKRRESQGNTGGGLLPRDGSEKLAAFDQHKGLLFSIAYRMLGSVADAEDMVQETFIRWQQASTDEVQSSRAFLVTIVSRLCINYLQSARVTSSPARR